MTNCTHTMYRPGDLCAWCHQIAADAPPSAAAAGEVAPGARHAEGSAPAAVSASGESADREAAAGRSPRFRSPLATIAGSAPTPSTYAPSPGRGNESAKAHTGPTLLDLLGGGM